MIPPMVSEATPVRHSDDVGCNLAEGVLCIFVRTDRGLWGRKLGAYHESSVVLTPLCLCFP